MSSLFVFDLQRRFKRRRSNAPARRLRMNTTPSAMDVDAIFGLIPASNDRLDMLKRALENGRSLDEDTCAYAAGHGELEILQWARASGCPWGEHTCTAAAYRGDFEVLKWARENGCPWDEGSAHARRRAATWRS